MIHTYSIVLSTIEKALRKLMEEYQRVRKSLWDLVEGQERNTAQLEKIRAIVKQRWGLNRGNKKEESEDDEERSEDNPRESQEEGTLLSASC